MRNRTATARHPRQISLADEEVAIQEVSARAVEELATRLAFEAGVAWACLGNHPGYAKNIWREKARDALVAAGLTVAAPVPLTEAGGPRFLS